MHSGTIGAAEAEAYIGRSFFNATFFSLYTLAAFLLYQRRADGDWDTEGSLRRIICLNESKKRISGIALVLGDYSELLGVLHIILFVAVTVWLYGEAQRYELAIYCSGIVLKHFFFNASLMKLDLSLFSYQGWQISKLPVVSPRGRKSTFFQQAPDPTEGEVTQGLAVCYGLAAISVLTLTNLIPVMTGHSAALLNTADDPISVFRVKRGSALVLELLSFVVMTTWLAKLLLSTNLLCLIFKQRLNAIRACPNMSALPDALRLSDQRIDSANILLGFTLIWPICLLVMSMFMDILQLFGLPIQAAAYNPTIASSAIWSAAFPMTLMAAKGIWIALQGAEVWKEKEKSLLVQESEEDCSDESDSEEKPPQISRVLTDLLTRTDSRATVTVSILPSVKVSLNRSLFNFFAIVLSSSVILRLFTLRHFSI